jgi:DNA-binding HxlR family transcriptional regulator
MHCSIAKAMAVLCEPWTPLVLRDLLLGFTQFEEIRRDLGISTNVLTDRLEVLVEHDVIERVPVGPHPRRHEYRLTEKGREAIPIILAMVAWGDRWETGRAGPPTHVVHETCGRPTSATIHCSECAEPLALEDLSYHRGPGSRRGPGTALLREHLEPPVEG